MWADHFVSIPSTRRHKVNDGRTAGGACILVELVGVEGTLAFGGVHSFAVVAFEKGYRPASALASAPELPAPASAADTCTPFVVRRRFVLGGWRVPPDRT